MKKLIFLITCIICSITISAQITRQNEQFEQVPLIKEKIAFIKEVKYQDFSASQNYEILQEWAKSRYGKNPFQSSIRYDAKKHEIVAKSKIELILPENSAGEREKMVMRYRIDAFIQDGKCVLQITELSYVIDNAKERKLPKTMPAEDLITDRVIAENSQFQELRVNTRKATLYFLNQLGTEFEQQFGY